MAIATTQGHVIRALDFYSTTGKYFIIGGTTPWTDESDPPDPSASDFKLNGVIGLKKVDNAHLVIPHNEGTIQYKNQSWKIIPTSVSTTVAGSGIAQGASSFTVASVSGFAEGSKVRIANLYEGKITNISGQTLTLDTAAPSAVAVGSAVLGGARIEGAKYVYLDCYLSYDEFPIATYRQIGLCTGVTPSTSDILRSAAYSVSGEDEYTSLGVLEILDNRLPVTRNADQREQLSLICEF